MSDLDVKDTEIAWAAGILDGEGYIGVQVRGDGRASVFLVVNTTSAVIATALAQVFGKLGATPTPWHARAVPGRPSSRPVATVRLTSMANVRTVLRACRPYLTAKAPEADVMLQYIDAKIGAPKGPRIQEMQIAVERALKDLKQSARMQRGARNVV